MNAMIDAIEESFKARLKTRGWLDAETEKRCEEKVQLVGSAGDDWVYCNTVLLIG